jgi:urea transporter
MTTVLGLIFGAAIMHNFKLAAGPLGVPAGGQILVVTIWILLFIIACSVTKSAKGS